MVNIIIVFFCVHAFIRQYLIIGRKHVLIKKYYALNKHVCLLTRLYGIAFTCSQALHPLELCIICNWRRLVTIFFTECALNFNNVLFWLTQRVDLDCMGMQCSLQYYGNHAPIRIRDQSPQTDAQQKERKSMYCPLHKCQISGFSHHWELHENKLTAKK